MSRAKKILVAIPSTLLSKVDQMAKYESRTRSDLVREALRRYYDCYAKAQNQSADVISLEQAYSATQSIR